MVKAHQGASTLPKDPAPLPGSAEPSALLTEPGQPYLPPVSPNPGLGGDKSFSGQAKPRGCSSDTVESCLPKPLL